jgi:hypothetical protein
MVIPFLDAGSQKKGPDNRVTEAIFKCPAFLKSNTVLTTFFKVQD